MRVDQAREGFMSNEGTKWRFHITRHVTSSRGDALDLFRTESSLMMELFQQWEKTSPTDKSADDAVVAKWDHGTVGKLLIEHAALRLAAAEEVARVVREVGYAEMADRLSHSCEVTRPIIDRMYDSGRGLQPISLAITPEFLTAVDELRGVLGDGFDDESAMEALAAALGTGRGALRRASYITRHAPARPKASGWLSRHLPLVVRVRTVLDRLAGFPWAESSLADRKLARRYERED
jgi:hypothetical protein